MRELEVESDMRVKDLMLEGIEKWDMERIMDIFLPNVATKVLSIVNLPTKQANKLIWALEKKDKVSVISSYKMIFDSQNLAYGESSNSTHLKLFWKAL